MNIIYLIVLEVKINLDIQHLCSLGGMQSQHALMSPFGEDAVVISQGVVCPSPALNNMTASNDCVVTLTMVEQLLDA